jgi:ankyrin repeat protein
MAKARKKLLPKDFEKMLVAGDITKLQAIFDSCDVNARGGYGRQTALAFDQCPDTFVRWLVAQGADLSAVDSWGRTPLHARAGSRRGRIDVLLQLGADVNSDSASIGSPLHAAAGAQHAENARLLLEWGARVDTVNREGLTPLELGLRECNNISLEHMVSLAIVLLEAGAKRTSRMKIFVEKIGKEFEWHRASFNPASVEAASTALDRLYELFDVPPVPRRQIHDVKLLIVLKASSWQEQHQELWQLLVPSMGHAATIQGEVIRISGRIAYELEDNGGVNWDAEFNKMADAFLEYVQTGHPLSSPDYAHAAAIVQEAKRRSGDPARLCKLAVAWVLLNPMPVKLEPAPRYRR